MLDQASKLPAPWPLYTPATFVPQMKIAADHGELVMTTHLPGVDPTSLKVTFEGQELLIEGERFTDFEVYRDGHIRKTREAGVFRRRLAIDFDLDPTKIKTTYRNGVVEVRLPVGSEPSESPEETTGSAEIPDHTFAFGAAPRGGPKTTRRRVGGLRRQH